MKELKVTPMELYFLGVQMQAEYIDYSYIAAMPDVQQRYALHEQETLEYLEERGLIEEDFSGNVEVDEEAAELLAPVFWGTVEGRVDADEGRRCNIHVRGDRMTAAILDKDEIYFYEADDQAIRKMLTGSFVTVSCSKIGGGIREKRFSKEELRKKASVEEALHIVKGDY